MRSRSPSTRRSTAPPSVFSDRSCCRIRRKSVLRLTDAWFELDDRRVVMASRQGMIRTTIALGLAVTLGAPLTASAQAGAGAGPAGAPPAGAQGGGRGRGGPPPYTPAP